MVIRQLNPYIHFSGIGERAIKRYESALDAKTQNIGRHGGIPGTKMVPDPWQSDVF